MQMMHRTFVALNAFGSKEDKRYSCYKIANQFLNYQYVNLLYYYWIHIVTICGVNPVPANNFLTHKLKGLVPNNIFMLQME